MRTFFAIDSYSTLQLSTIRKLLSLKLKPTEYELLPLQEEMLHFQRSDLARLLESAHREGRKVLSHYTDAPRCIVVFGYNVSTSMGNTGRFDYACVLDRQGSCLHRLLNPLVPGKATHWVSSASIQPELAETLLEVAGISW